MTNNRDFPWNNRPEYVAIRGQNGPQNVRNSISLVSVDRLRSRRPAAFVTGTAGTASSGHGESQVSHRDRDNDQLPPTKRQMLEEEIEMIREEMRSFRTEVAAKFEVINQRLDALEDRMLEQRLGAYRREP